MITLKLRGNNMKSIVLFFFILCFVFASNLRAGFMSNRYVPEEYVVISENVLVDMGKKLSKRHNMVIIGTGGGLAKCVNMLSLSFDIKGPLSKDKLREILVNCVEEFLLALNSNEKLRPHLKTYPFTSEGIDIALYVVDGDGIEIYDPNVSVASTWRDKILYRTVDKNNPYGYKTEIEEDYEAALKIVKGEKPSN